MVVVSTAKLRRIWGLYSQEMSQQFRNYLHANQVLKQTWSLTDNLMLTVQQLTVAWSTYNMK